MSHNCKIKISFIFLNAIFQDKISLFNIISVDVRSRHGGDFIYDFSNGFDTWLLLLVHTRSVFRIDGEDRVFPADSLVLFKPEMPIYYRS